MKKFSIVILILLSSISVYSQILTPVTWDSEVKEVDGDTITLLMHASIEENWHLYTQNIPDGGPIPTTFTFDNPNNDFELVGETIESESHTSFDKIFEMDLGYFDITATFTQKIRLLNKDISAINVLVDFQSCDDEKCIFESAKMSFHLSNEKPNAEKVDGEEAKVAVVKKTKTGSNRDMWTIFFLAFLSGFAALLTPCVFPMIPLTVSFFTKQSKNKATGIRNAILYGLFIIVIYVLLGTLVTWIFGADALNALSTNVWFNIIFFLLLVIFAVFRGI